MGTIAVFSVLTARHAFILGIFLLLAAIPCILVGFPLAAVGLHIDRRRGKGTGIAVAGSAANITAALMLYGTGFII